MSYAPIVHGGLTAFQVGLYAWQPSPLVAFGVVFCGLMFVWSVVMAAR